MGGVASLQDLRNRGATEIDLIVTEYLNPQWPIVDYAMIRTFLIEK
jgi:hypothetical protein